MNRKWSDAELQVHWVVGDAERLLLKGKTSEGRLFFSVQLKYYQHRAEFPEGVADVGDAVLEFIARQVNAEPEWSGEYAFDGRSSRRHRQEIFSYLNIKPFDDLVETKLRFWLVSEVFVDGPSQSYINELVTHWFLENRVEKPAHYRLNRIIKSAEREFERALFVSVGDHLTKSIRARLDALILDQGDESDFSYLCGDVGPVGLESVLQAIEKLEILRDLNVPDAILQNVHPKLIRRYRQRAATENAWELRRHPPAIRYALLVFYCVPREAELIDGLVELLIQIIHRISVRAERKVIKELVADITKVRGKATLLFKIAEATLEKPDGAVRDVVYPVASEDVIKQLVKEFRASGPAYVNRIYTKIRSSYAHHYRKMLPRILGALEFRSNNATWRTTLDAIDIIKVSQDSRAQYYPVDAVPVEGLIQNKWKEIVVEQSPDGTQRINRINYEICVLQVLREKLRCKEIWVVGADRFCNPDDDLPADFEDNRKHYYDVLGWPTDPEDFIKQAKTKLIDALGRLNDDLPKNNNVLIRQHGKKSKISVAALVKQEDPPTLEAIKRELGHRWPETSLLDVLKETNFRVGFTNSFSTAAVREVTDQQEVLRRLLFTLYALGTNAGLKRLASGRQGVSYKELLHIRNRYINKDSLRDAIQRVVNAIFEARLTSIWGEATTSCASDSTQFASWDQNLMTEWHVRYGGRGVMIYWHVDKNSACIYSQLKRCSSSEAASMIEGVLHHCTNMKVEKQYVDSHGQSVVAFAFSHLLGFSLMPRLKAISKQKLCLPETGTRQDYPNIESICSKNAINWELIKRQYDELIKLTTALREHTATPEAILRRFTRNNAQHPTYLALIELGKAVKTMFLCEYLISEELRREINTGLNVIERWNGVNGFIYFGKKGEMASNKPVDQEISVLALHLLQICLVYINTLMIQQVLKDEAWRSRMTPRDMAALSPLPHGHINPYGIFELNMEDRLTIDDLPVAA